MDYHGSLARRGNGIAFAPDERTLYVSNSEPKRAVISFSFTVQCAAVAQVSNNAPIAINGSSLHPLP